MGWGLIAGASFEGAGGPSPQGKRTKEKKKKIKKEGNYGLWITSFICSNLTLFIVPFLFISFFHFFSFFLLFLFSFFFSLLFFLFVPQPPSNDDAPDDNDFNHSNMMYR